MHLGDRSQCILSPDEMESELLLQMPEEFPCIVLLPPWEVTNASGNICFLYRNQIKDFAIAMGLVGHYC